MKSDGPNHTRRRTTHVRFLAVTNEQDYAKLHDIVSGSFVWQAPAAPGGEVRDPDAAEDVIRKVTGAFPNFHAEIVDMLTAGDTGTEEVRFTMTHEGEFDGIPATGQEAELPAMLAWHVADGKLQELRDYADMQVLFERLGVSDKDTATNSTDSPTQIVQKAYSTFGNNDWDQFFALFADDFEWIVSDGFPYGGSI